MVKRNKKKKTLSALVAKSLTHSNTTEIHCSSVILVEIFFYMQKSYIQLWKNNTSSTLSGKNKTKESFSLLQYFS